MNNKSLSKFYYLQKEIVEHRMQKKNVELDIQMLEDTDIHTPIRLRSIPDLVIDTNDESIIIKLKAELEDVQRLINLKTEQCICEYNRINRFIQDIDDSLTRRIFKFRFIEMCSWDKVAYKVGGNNTKDSVQKICSRYLKKTGNF